jgi:hypothetical protein
MNGFNVHMPSGTKNEQLKGGPGTPNGITVIVTVTGIVMVTVTRNLLIIRKKRKIKGRKIA